MYHSILAFRGINKSTNIRPATGNGAVCCQIGLASGVIRGNATPPNMNRSLINVRAINRRIIVLGFAPTIIGEEWDSSKPERHDARRKLLRAFLFPLLRRNSTTEWERSFFTTFPNILRSTVQTLLIILDYTLFYRNHLYRRSNINI